MVEVLGGNSCGIERSRLRFKRCSFWPDFRPELLPEMLWGKNTCGKISDAQSNDIVNKNVVLDTPFKVLRELMKVQLLFNIANKKRSNLDSC